MYTFQDGCGPSRPCTRPVHSPFTAVYTAIHSRVHVRLHGPCTRSRTRTVCRTAVACHLGTCTRPGRPTCRIHGPDGRVHGVVHGPVYGAVYAPCTRPKTSVQTARAHVRGRVRAMYTAEDVRADGPCTVMYTGGIDGPCARPIHGRVRAVYTAGPLYSHVWAVFAGEDEFTGRVHGRLHGPYAAAQRPSTRPWTARTQTCNFRVDFPCTPYTCRCNVCVHVSPAHGPCTRTWTGRVDGPCVYTVRVYGCLHGPYVYTTRTRR